MKTHGGHVVDLWCIFEYGVLFELLYDVFRKFLLNIIIIRQF